MRALIPALLVIGCRSTDKLLEDTLTDTGGLSVDADGDGYDSSEDCDDNNSLVNPSAAELCDGADNDCDGEIDEDVTTTFYADTDGDGFGDNAAPSEACEAPAGTVPTGNDCDDTDPLTYPSAPERCDEIDNDCDGTVDEDVTTTFYADADTDGYGDPAASVEDCDPGSGYVSSDDDCDDTDPLTYPGAEEVCDEADNDCDGAVDEDVTTTFYEDTDADQYGLSDETTEACALPTGYAEQPGDCDDTDATISPDAEEVCDNIDNDCDGSIDEDDAADALVWYADDDSDGFGDVDTTTAACTQPSGYTSDDTDCDDTDADISPDAEEVCDSVDNDCDGDVDEDDATDAATWYADDDGDGYGDADDSAEACAQPTGFVSDADDCDDGEATISPDGEEVCDEVDNDCDGDIDEDDATDAATWYADDDGDGFGDADDSAEACAQPSGFVSDADDCDDADADISPDGVEVCDSVDNDCDGDVDESDAWWSEDWPYRIQVTLTGSSEDVDGPPVALDVDFGAALGDLGDSDAFDEDTLRVVLQDCGLGQPELPSQFLDGWQGIFDKSDPSDTTGDEAGAVVFLYDEDGDYTGLETLSAGSVVEVALYFGGSEPAPSYSTDLASSSSGLSTGLTDAAFDSSAGGMLSSLLYGSAPDLMSQADSCCGNSIYISSWGTDPQDGSGTLTEEASGPIFAAVSATGSRSSGAGSYDYTYTYWMFAGRPELYSRVYQETTSATTLSHSGDYTSGVRPWESQSADLTDSSTTFTVDTTDYLYADASDGSWGVAFSYVQPPDHLTGLTFYDPYLIVMGNDYAASTGTTPGSMPSGTAYFDHVVMLVLPHAGTYSDVQPTLDGLTEGLTASAAAAEAR